MTGSSVAFIGLGLIGGSIAKGIKRANPDTRIMAYMRSRSRLEQAKEDHVIDVILDGVDEHLRECDFVFLCTPVEHNVEYLSKISPYLKPGAILTDVGSTKEGIHAMAEALGLESSFIGGHPMAGSEKTGYENSTDHLLENAYYMITPTKATTEEQIGKLVSLAKAIGSIPIVLNYQEHDSIVAAISHLPHIIASSLVNLIKASDNPQGMMKQLAAGGFKDITRIASASPDIWEQICMMNNQNIIHILKCYIASLNQILDDLKAQDTSAIYDLFLTSREYRNSINDKPRGSVLPDYSFTVDIVDKSGSISTLSAILASRGINIMNIGINHNREHGEGALKISFYDKQSWNLAWNLLEKYHYELRMN